MNAPTLRFALLAFAAALPVAASAPSAGGSSGSSSSSNNTTSPSGGDSQLSRDTRPTSAGSTTPSSSTPSVYGSQSGSQAGTTSGSRIGASGDAAGNTMNIQRVSGEAMDSQLTAKALLGKDVYDNSNKKIGEVRDVVLDPSRAPQLASALASKPRTSGANTMDVTGSSTGTTTGMGNTTAVPGNTNSDSRLSGATAGDASAHGSTTAGVASSGSPGAIGGPRNTDATGGMGATAGQWANTAHDLASLATTGGSEPAAIISYGGFLGAGGTLFRVPLSQLQYDATNDRITLSVSDGQLSSLANPNAARGAAE